MPERIVYTVSRLTRAISALLQQSFGGIWVEGELSSITRASSGHWYFDLKDREAQLRCVMFRSRNIGLGFEPVVGQQLLARGRLNVYEKRGEYQLTVEHLEEAGVGPLHREFERLKARLAAEGLFAAELKRPLPRFPRRIGVITSPSGAAVRDILHVLARRFAAASVLIYPTAVQGAAAAPAILTALQLASARRECDVLILARGGGSIQDLWGFNDEGVARAIRTCSVPVVCGIGHEIDFTIADFAADRRAPTPSGAAELVVPDGRECLAVLANGERRLVSAIHRELRAARVRHKSAEHRLRLLHPGHRLAQRAQRLDDLEQRLHAAARQCINVRTHRLDLLERALRAMGPEATLARGFAIVTRVSDRALLTDSATVKIGEEFEARLAHGRLRGRVTSKD